MKIKLIITLFLSLYLHNSIAQKPVDINSQLDKRNFSVVLKAIEYLRKNKNVAINFKDTLATKKADTIYNTFINTFFDLSYLRDSLKDEKDPFEARVELQKVILYNIDYYLDILPRDSIWLSPLKSIALAEDANSYPPNTLVAFYPIANEPFYSAIIFFNEQGKISFVSQLLQFEKRNKPNDIEQFFLRHNYNQIKDKLWRP